MGVTQEIPLLYVSVASAQGRACAMAQSTGPEVAQLAEQFLELEDRGCRLPGAFRTNFYLWAWEAQQRQKSQRKLLDSSAIRAALQQGNDTYCLPE